MKKTKPKATLARTPRINAEQHKDDLRVLATASPKKLVQDVLKGYGLRKEKSVG